MRPVLLFTALAMVAPLAASGQKKPKPKSEPPAKSEQPAEGEQPAKSEPPAKPSLPAPRPPPQDDQAYSARLRAMEQRVSELKERVFRSKARLNLLRETVLHGVIAGSRAVIVHRNEMGGSFRLIKAVYSIDGSKVFAQSDDTGALDEKDEFEVFNGTIVPGNHTVSVVLEYKGHGYGLFPYLKGYTFKVRASHTFTAADGKQTVVKVVGYEKGNFTTDLKDRPAVDFRVNVVTPRVRKAKTRQ